MDIMLERILSLIPKKQNGEFVHGSLKDFAAEIGLKSGNVIADWIAGRSKSYGKKIHEISAKYDVSIEWLRGETDRKEKLPSTVPDGEEPLDALDVQLIGYVRQMTTDQKELLLAQMKTLKERQAPTASDRK